jgi:hypothetical protein
MRVVVPKLRSQSISALMRETGLSRRMLIKARKGQVRPHIRNQQLLANAVNRLILGAKIAGSSC